MLFSILIPAYNAEKYIQECIESVLKQQYKNFEVIIFDDGSFDNTFELCKKYTYEDNRIRLYKQQNKGLLKTRRELIKKANGDYFIFLDADDYLDDVFLKDILEPLQEKKADLLIYNYRKVNETGKILKTRSINHGKNSLYVVDDFHHIIKALVTSSDLNNLVSKVVKKEIAHSDFTNYDSFENLKNGEDLLQSLPLLFNSEKILILNKTYYNYRQVKGSMSSEYKIDYFKDVFTVRTKVKEYLTQYGYDDKKYLLGFYKYIINNVWRLTLMFFSSNPNEIDRKEVLDYISHNPLILESVYYLTTNQNSLVNLKLDMIINKKYKQFHAFSKIIKLKRKILK